MRRPGNRGTGGWEWIIAAAFGFAFGFLWPVAGEESSVVAGGGAPNGEAPRSDGVPQSGANGEPSDQLRPRPVPPMPEPPRFADVNAATPEEIAAFNEAFGTVARHYPEELAAWVEAQWVALKYLDADTGRMVFAELFKRDAGLAVAMLEDGVLSLDRQELVRRAIRRAASRDKEWQGPLYEALADGPFRRAAQLGMALGLLSSSEDPVRGLNFLAESDLWEEVGSLNKNTWGDDAPLLREVLDSGLRDFGPRSDEAALREFLDSIKHTPAFDVLYMYLFKNRSRHLHEAFSQIPEENTHLREWVLTEISDDRADEVIGYIVEDYSRFDSLSAATRRSVFDNLMRRNPGEAFPLFAESGDLKTYMEEDTEGLFSRWAGYDLRSAFEFYQTHPDLYDGQEEMLDEFRSVAELYNDKETLEALAE